MIKLTLDYTNGSSRTTMCEDMDDAKWEVYNEGDHLLDWSIERDDNGEIIEYQTDL
jgi:hypothetical protein